VLQLRVFGASQVITDVASQLEVIPGARHVILTADGAAGNALVTAELVDDAVDQALARINRLELPSEDVVLLRLDSIGPAVAQRPLASVVWADLLSQAGANARPLARYFVFMATAGIIAAFGVIYAETTLIVGAMAISPDTCRFVPPPRPWSCAAGSSRGVRWRRCLPVWDVLALSAES
jgi:hypothetical protein